MGTSSKRCRLRKKTSVYKRRRKVGICLPFDEHTTTNEVIADREALQADLEVATLPSKLEQRGLPLGIVDAKLVAGRQLFRRRCC